MNQGSRAVAHTERMARHVAKVLGSRPYDLEMSVDETDNPTTPVEHFFVGMELKRRAARPSTSRSAPTIWRSCSSPPAAPRARRA